MRPVQLEQRSTVGKVEAEANYQLVWLGVSQYFNNFCDWTEAHSLNVSRRKVPLDFPPLFADWTLVEISTHSGRVRWDATVILIALPFWNPIALSNNSVLEVTCLSVSLLIFSHINTHSYIWLSSWKTCLKAGTALSSILHPYPGSATLVHNQSVFVKWLTKRYILFFLSLAGRQDSSLPQHFCTWIAGCQLWIMAVFYICAFCEVWEVCEVKWLISVNW